MPDTSRLSRKEHLMVKIEDGQRFTVQEKQWAAELLNERQLDDAEHAGCFEGDDAH
jgi:hypothetical protein